MPKVLITQYQYVANYLRINGVKIFDNYPDDILHMAKERIQLQKCVKRKKTVLKRQSFINSR
jgi:hypothetical protein